VEPLLVLNARDTFMHRHNGADGVRDFDDGCTSFCVLPGSSADGHVWAGQNWDYHPDIRDTVLLLHVIPDDGPTQLWIVEAGQVGRQGVNTHGLALQANGLPSERRVETALPGPIARRRILAADSWDQALARALDTPRAGRTNLLLVSRDGRTADVEGSYTTSRLSVAEGKGWITHANHFQLGAPPDLVVDRGPSTESVARSASAHRAIGGAEQRGGVALEDLMSLARSHEDRTGQVCDHGKLDAAWMTVASTITDLTEGTTYVAAGPPCEHAFVAIDVESGRVRPVASDALR
jgi:isopenicillin-N N-acyltransferase-like protein